MNMKKLFVYLPVLILILAALACGTSQPVTFDEIPVFAGAVQMETGQSEMADILIDSMEASTGGKDFTTEFKTYGLVAGTTWDTIKSFYSEQMGENWEVVPDLSTETGEVRTAGWSRGQFNNEQIFIIAFSDDPFSGQSFLITGLFTE